LENAASYKQAVQSAVEKLIEESLPVAVDSLTIEDAKKAGHNAYPGASTVRVVRMGSFGGCACGGTHLQNTNQLTTANFVVKKISSKKGITRMSYQTE
jgi:alanyl-tRNA synthetase